MRGGAFFILRPAQVGRAGVPTQEGRALRVPFESVLCAVQRRRNADIADVDVDERRRAPGQGGRRGWRTVQGLPRDGSSEEEHCPPNTTIEVSRCAAVAYARGPGLRCTPLTVMFDQMLSANLPSTRTHTRAKRLDRHAPTRPNTRDVAYGAPRTCHALPRPQSGGLQ